MVEARINLRFSDMCVITTQQYEQIKRDIEARYYTGCNEIGDTVLANLLVSMEYRYHEAKRDNVRRRRVELVNSRSKPEPG